MTRRSFAVLLVALLGGLSCSAPSPEDQIESRIRQARAAFQHKDVRALRELVATDYSDSRGNDRDGILQLVSFHLSRHRAVHSVYRITEIDLARDGAARSTVLVGLAAERIEDATMLERVDADLLRIEIDWARSETGDWRIASAEWRSADVGEFLR